MILNLLAKRCKMLSPVPKRSVKQILQVLIEGESGTGKEILAHAIHNYSSRRNKPLWQ